MLQKKMGKHVHVWQTTTEPFRTVEGHQRSQHARFFPCKTVLRNPNSSDYVQVAFNYVQIYVVFTFFYVINTQKK